MKIQPILLTILCFSFISTIMAQDFPPLYDKNIPNYIDTPNEQTSSVSGGILRISKVSIPTYAFYPSKVGNNSTTKPVVVICPGGGYGILAAQHEGDDIAKKFNENGIHALVLYYRIPNSLKQIDKKIAPLQDAQQAIRIVRKNATSWGIDINKVGIMGFSAGGHLASSAATHFLKDYTGINDGINLRPDFQILLYPVISFRDFSHSGSRNSLIGTNAPEELVNLFSNEEQITKETPQAFIVHASDDKAVPLKNALIYAENLVKNQVKVDLHVYANGGHGFGLNNKTTQDDWFKSLIYWFKSQQIL